jgi:excisionase family DNA binding protein
MPSKLAVLPTARDELVEEGLESLESARRFLGSIGRSTLYELMERGELPYVMVGRRRMLPRRALREYAARNLRGA